MSDSNSVASELDLGTEAGRVVSIETDAPCAVIGDIHGRVDLLEKLLARLPRDVTVLVVGDLCDRGPDTRRVLDLLIERGARGALGNHEECLIGWARGDGFLHEARAIGATATLASYDVNAKPAHEVSALSDAVPREHLAFLESLGHAVDLRVQGTPFWIVHAGVTTTQALGRAGTLDRVVPYLAEHHPDVLLWAHTDPSATLPVDRPVIMGHVCRPAGHGPTTPGQLSAATRARWQDRVMEPDMTKQNDDALVRAAAEVRAASAPRLKRMESERAAKRLELDVERRELDVLRSRLAAVAPAADAWFRRWARSGRLELVLRARADEHRTRVALPRFHFTSKGALWEHEGRRGDRGQHRWYELSMGETHSLFGGLAGCRMGGPGGELGTFRSLAELAQKKMKYPTGHWWPGMEADVLHVGVRVAEVLRDDSLEPMLVSRLQAEALHLRKTVRRESAELALLRGEPGGEQLYREVIAEQGLTNDVLTADMLVHVARTVGTRSGRR